MFFFRRRGSHVLALLWLGAAASGGGGKDHSPTQMPHQRRQALRTGTATAKAKKAQDECPGFLTFDTASPSAHMVMGLYDQTDIEHKAHGGRLVYARNGDRPYVYYWEAFSQWRIGDDYSKPTATFTSGNDPEAECPSDVKYWYERVDNNTKWSLMSVNVTSTESSQLEDFGDIDDIFGTDEPGKRENKTAGFGIAGIAGESGEPHAEEGWLWVLWLVIPLAVMCAAGAALAAWRPSAREKIQKQDSNKALQATPLAVNAEVNVPRRHRWDKMPQETVQGEGDL